MNVIESMLGVHPQTRKSGQALVTSSIIAKALTAFLCLEQTRPLHAGVAKHNVASIRVLQKCGFKLSHSVEEASIDADASHVSSDANSLIFECGRGRPPTP